MDVQARAGFLLAVLLLGLAAFAEGAPRLEVVAEFEGVRQPGVDVCFSKGRRSGGVVERMTSGPEVRCLSADRILKMPRGTWHLYAVTAAEPLLVSTDPIKIVFSQDSNENYEAGRLIVELVRGARLNLAELGEVLPGRSRTFYAANREGPPAIVPIAPGATSVIIPAGVPVRVLEMEGDMIERVSTALTVGSQESQSARWDDSGTVVIPITIGSGEVSLAGRTMPALHVVHRYGDVVHRFPLSKESNALLFLPTQTLKPGTYDVRSDDDRWLSLGSPFRWPAASGSLLVVKDVLLEPAVAAATLSWTLDPGLLESRSACGDDAAIAAFAELRMFQCPAGIESLNRHTERECSLLKAEKVTTAAGQVSWPRPATGNTWAELAVGRQSNVASIVSTRGESRADLRLTPRALRGRIRLGKDPFAATVLCGPSFSTSDSVTGSFRCWLQERAQFPMALEVRPCDSSQPFLHVVESSEAADRFVDIIVPANELTARVLDANGSPVSSANVWSYLGADESDSGSSRSWGATGAQGVVIGTRFPTGQDFTVCAGKPGYRKACRSVTLSASQTSTVALTLLSETTIQGSVVSPKPIVNGQLFAVANGRLLQRAVVRDDGSFAMDGIDPQASSFVLSSDSLPLTVLTPGGGEDTLLLSVPPVLESRDVTVEASARGPLTLLMNGVLVPVDVTAHHQSRWREEYYVQPDQPVVLRRINGFGTVFVVFGRGASVTAFENPGLFAAMPKRIIGRESSMTFH